jgi:hypothetical protein
MSKSIRRHAAARAVFVPDPSALMAYAGKAKVLTAVVAGGGRAALRGAAGRVVKEGLSQTLGPHVARQVLRGGPRLAARAAPVLAVLELAVDQSRTVAARRRGELSRREYRARTGGNFGNAAGGMGGASGGAALGTMILPGVGTLIGGLLGGMLGGSLGRAAGERVCG